jgi:hypothetical protein
LGFPSPHPEELVLLFHVLQRILAYELHEAVDGEQNRTRAA